MPVVSIVMPSYNHAKYISHAIESVLQQDFTDFELIIIDDTSKDNSVEVIEGFRIRDKRIRAIYHNKNQGVYKTYNEGINASQGKYIAILDSDDMWVKNKLSEQVRVLESNENLIVWSEGEIIDEAGNPTGKKFTGIYGAPDKQRSGHILGKLLKNNYILGSSFIAAKEILRNAPFSYELKHLNDWLFFAEIAERHEYYFIDRLLTQYRIHSTSSNKDDLGYLKDYLKICRIFMSKYKDVISRDVKSCWYEQIAALYRNLGCEWHVDFYAIKRFLVDPHDRDARDNLSFRLKSRYPFLYKIITNVILRIRKLTATTNNTRP